MNSKPSAWVHVFPGLRIPEVLAYVVSTWEWLRQAYVAQVVFERSETVLTDNLCEALSDPDRRFQAAMACEFLSETWELRRDHSGKVVRVARADIRVILGEPGTPHLVIEFKKLDGSVDARWRYCFEGITRFVEGKYAAGHEFGIMCGLVCVDLDLEARGLAVYIAQDRVSYRLNCMANQGGAIVAEPSPTDPECARFDTKHDRPTLRPEASIILLHVLMPCSRGIAAAP